jgi:hypothetical protein
MFELNDSPLEYYDFRVSSGVIIFKSAGREILISLNLLSLKSEKVKINKFRNWQAI